MNPERKIKEDKPMAFEIKKNDGYAKNSSREKKMPNREFQKSEQREVRLKDVKTSVFVNKNDPRTDDEIRDIYQNRRR